MSRLLITGATGFIGRNLLPVLSRRHEVFAIARHVPPATGNTRVRWIEHDLSRPLDRAGLPAKIDAVIHLAQSRHYREFPQRADDIFRINVQSTVELLDYARHAGAQRFLYASSGGVYGHSDEQLVESHPVNPLNFYLSTKYAAELMVANYRHLFHTIVFRFFFVYGPGQTGMLIASLLDRVRRGETITIDGNPGMRINPTYIDDAVQVVEPALALDRSELFNVSGDETVTITELVRRCGEVLAVEPNITCRDVPGQRDLVGANARLIETLAVRPQVSLSDGLARTAAGANGNAKRLNNGRTRGSFIVRPHSSEEVGSEGKPAKTGKSA